METEEKKEEKHEFNPEENHSHESKHENAHSHQEHHEHHSHEHESHTHQEKHEEKKEDRTLEKRKERIIKWLKDPHNLLLLGVLIFSFAVLFYYFNMTKTQTLWWDEAEYMSTAKLWAFGVPYYINPQRPPLFPFFSFLLYEIGLNDITIKFLLEIFPAWLVVLFTYLLVKEMYHNKKLALVAAFITSTCWIILFYAMRFMTDSLGLLFGTLAFYCFWKGYMNNKGKIYIWLIGFFVSLSFLCRLTGVLFGLSIFAFLLFTDKFRFIKNKHLWISLLIAFLTITPFLIWSYSYYHDPLAFRSGYGGIQKIPIGWNLIGLVYDYPEFGFFILFLVGLVTLVSMIISIDRLILKSDKAYFADFFIALNLIVTLSFFIYFLREAENRWLIMMAVSIFVISAKGILMIYDLSRKNLGKIISILILVGLLAFGAYYELNHADMIIKYKLPSYQEVKNAGLWVKSNSLPSDSVMTISATEFTYYTERKIYNYGDLNVSQSIKMIKDNHPTFFTFSPVYETGMLMKDIPAWVQKNVGLNNSLFIPVDVEYMDEQKTQMAFVVFKINYDSPQFKEL